MELPRLEPLWQKYQEQGLRVVAIESEHDTERAVEFIAENDVLRFCFPLAALPVWPAAWVLDRSAVPPPSCLRCWNFSRMDDSLDWYWFMRSVDVSAPVVVCGRDPAPKPILV